MAYTIIDCHTHVYPDKVARRAVESIGDFYGIPMDGSGRVDALLQTAREAGISKCLALAVSVDAAHVSHINDFLIATVQAHPHSLWGFATLHAHMEDPGKEVERVLKAGMKGIKLHPDMQHFRLDEERTDRLFAACEGVCPMLFHTGDKRYNNSNPALIPPILRRHPRLQLICAHFGGFSQWEEAAQCLADENVYVDTSSSLPFLSPDQARALIALYGEDRILFGSDSPMWNPKNDIDALLALGLPERTLQKIFSENLLRLLNQTA